MSLTTPTTIRRLQRKLYTAAKAEPARRFHQLYDKMYREDILVHAYSSVRATKGARTPGVDGETFAEIEEQGTMRWLAGLLKELRNKTYRPQPVRRVMIPKKGGGQRPLGIPTVRDRVAQTAAKLVVEPIFEADFADCAYGYRPKRSAQNAVQSVHQAIREGYTDVVDADLSKYLDPSSHYPRALETRLKRSGWGSGTLMRKPFLRPRHTCTASSSPRFTRCNTVWRVTPRSRVASIMGT